VLFTDEDIETWPAHMEDFVERYCYAHRDKPGTWVLELDNGRFMNHSSNPNTNFEEFYAGYAVRDIGAGDELTCNYFDFDINFRGAFNPEEKTSENRLAR
jgi:SET domain-containing protein